MRSLIVAAVLLLAVLLSWGLAVAQETAGAEALQRLARISHPRVTVDTSGLSPEATELANLLAERISELPDDVVARMLEAVKKAG